MISIDRKKEDLRDCNLNLGSFAFTWKEKFPRKKKFETQRSKAISAMYNKVFFGLAERSSWHSILKGAVRRN